MSLIITSCAVVFCVVTALYARYTEPNRLVLRKIKIDSGRRINNGKPLRICLFSDLHYPRYTTYRMVRRAIEKSNLFDPDLVFVLGDFFDKNRSDPAILPGNIDALLGSIRSRFGVYGVLGNHDHWFDELAIRNALASKTEIRLIDNASARIDLPAGPSISWVSGISGRAAFATSRPPRPYRRIPPFFFCRIIRMSSSRFATRES